MINNRLAVIFSFDKQLFAIENDLVEEFVWLPLLTPLEEQPAYVCGAFELRGSLVRVIDLNLRLGRPSQLLQSSQIVIVTRSSQGYIGVIADELVDLNDISMIEGSTTTIESDLFRSLVLSQFELNNKMGTLITPEELVVGDTFPFEYLIERRDRFEQLSSRDLEKLTNRQNNYRLIESPPVQGLTHNVVITSISGEYFGFEVELIKEFTYLGKFYPLPGTPSFIVGNANLRGEIVTVFDISSLLGVDSVRIREQTRIIVYSFEQQLIGFVVDDLLDITTVEDININQLPIGIPKERRLLLKGECKYDQQTLIIVDTHKIFTTGQLVVEQV